MSDLTKWKHRVTASGVVLATSLAVGCASSSAALPSPGSFAHNLAQAKAAVAAYTGKPSPFPVTAPLPHKPKKGTTFVFMDCGTPICAQFKSLVTPAAKALGVKLTVIQAGATASSVNSAFDSVAQLHPSAIINTALDPIEWTQALKRIKAEHIPVISTGVVDGASYGLTTYPNATPFGAGVTTLDGKLQADWVFVHEGKKANVEYNWVPELSFSKLLLNGFTSQLKILCPSCQVRPLSIPVADLGSSAPQAIVSDLQAHPATNTVVGSNSENLLGLPAALKVAGLANITTVGTAATPVNLQYLKAGEQTVDLALDLPVLSWELVDAAARASEGAPITGLEAAGLPPEEFLTGKSITFNPSKGWTGYPNFASRFVKLWSGK